MENYNLKKGLIFGIICVFLIGFQPIISTLRPTIIDTYSFSTITVVFMAIIFFPIFIVERYKLKSLMKNESNVRTEALLNGWKKKRNVKLFIAIGIAFSIVPILLILGFLTINTCNFELKKAIVLGYSLFVYLMFTYFLGLVIAVFRK